MLTVLLLIHILMAIALIGVVLLQRTEGGGLGFGGGGGGGNFMTTRGTANLLTRMTAILATCFMATSLLLVVLGSQSGRPRSIVDDLRTPLSVPAVPAPAAPAQPIPTTPAQPVPPQGQGPAPPTR
ncbi:MAG: preprotein translocase subunit SecG [Proteobacteria bacterium]|nr:preprotein translocase subunit SecG [Pseudomonadota bacterium]MBI3496044.1 preprotein translocase subunit SecG [Pseudomonadota bacterium]